MVEEAGPDARQCAARTAPLSARTASKRLSASKVKTVTRGSAGVEANLLAIRLQPTVKERMQELIKKTTRIRLPLRYLQRTPATGSNTARRAYAQYARSPHSHACS